MGLNKSKQDVIKVRTFRFILRGVSQDYNVNHLQTTAVFTRSKNELSNSLTNIFMAICGLFSHYSTTSGADKSSGVCFQVLNLDLVAV